MRLRLSIGTACLLLGALPAVAQIQIRNEDVALRFGFQGQFWADWNQDTAGLQPGYQQNLYLRRVRLIVGGDVGDNIGFFFQSDSPNLGKTPKAMSSGFLIQDAFLEWRLHRAFQIEGGVMFAPFSRQQMQSPSSYYTLDISAVSTVSNAATTSSALRDTGFAGRGFFFHDRLQYRAGIFQGQRDANARNSLRTTAYVQYDFFEPEKGYAYIGTALGKKRILAIDAGIDRQGSYRAYSANVASNTPVRSGDEVGLNVQYLHFDGRRKFLSIPQQNNLLAEFAYYLHRVKLQPFGRLESQAFTAEVNRTKDVARYGGGCNYYVRGQALKWTAQLLRSHPRSNSLLRPGNEFTLQMQFFYF